MKRKLIILAAAVAVAACSTSEETTTLVADGVARFSSEISTRVSTDLSDKSSAWEAGDQIGISMSGTASSSNVPYVAQRSGTATSFEVAEGADKLLYPNSGSVTFAAYSPYSSAVSSSEITLDVSDQSTEAKRNACDFMFSANGSGSYATSNEAVELQFDHQMAMLVFNVKTNESMSDLTGLEVTASGIVAKRSYSVLNGSCDASGDTAGEIVMWSDVTEVADGSDTATVSALVHPWVDSSSATTFAEFYYVSLVCKVDGMAVSAAAASGYSYKAGNIYTYEVTIGNDYLDISNECTITKWVDNDSSGSVATDTTNTEDIFYNETLGAWEIYTVEGFEAFATKVTSDASVNGLLMADIDLGGSAESQWTPIVYGSYGSYTGTFDGGNHLISGLYISSSSNTQGLFGYIGSGGVVKNLGVSGEVTGNGNVGGIAGAVEEGSILNCYNMATIKGSDQNTGGVVGNCKQSGTVMNCYNTGAVTGVSNVGGVAGNNEANVKNCYNTGAVTGTSDFVAGVVGYSEGSITNCYNAGVVTANGNSGSGGVVGWYNNGSISNCYWADDVGSDVTLGIGSDNSSSATAMSAEEMKTAAFAATLNDKISGDMFSWAQYFGVNGGYPTLVVE